MESGKKKKAYRQTSSKIKKTDWCLPEVGVEVRVGVKWVKRVKRAVFKQVSHGNVIYSMVTIVSNTVLYILKLLRE